MTPPSDEPEKDELSGEEAAPDAADTAADAETEAPAQDARVSAEPVAASTPDEASAEDSESEDAEVAEPVAQAAEEAPAEEAPAPKPRRRRKKAAAAPESEAEVAAEEPEADAETETETETEAADDEPAAPAAPRQPAPTRRRSRRDPELPAPIVRAQAKYVRSSARKARLVCDNIRGKSVDEARAILALTPRAIARDWSKLLESAVANAEHNHELVGEDLVVKAVHADEGPTIKRFRPRAMGRATRIRKRTSHLTILLTPKD
jgi:ribosomal protein L22